MSSPGVTEYEGTVCDPDLPTRIDAVEVSLEALHEKMDIVLAALDDRKTNIAPTNESN